jgi:hypothetical protein
MTKNLKKILFMTASFFMLQASAFAEVLPFQKEIKSCLSANYIWQDLANTLKDSTPSKIWPNNLSRMRGSGLINGSEVKVSYRTFFGWTVYPYEVRHQAPETAFDYLARGNHPFKGGARVTVTSKEGATLLLWQGSYFIPKDKSFERSFFVNYTKDFFAALERNIRTVESRVPCRLK